MGWPDGRREYGADTERDVGGAAEEEVGLGGMIDREDERKEEQMIGS